MGIREIFAFFTDKVLPAIPGILLRFLYPPEKISSQICIDLCGEIPIDPSLSLPVPQVYISLSITNLGNIDLTLDRILIDVWFGQPTLQMTILEPYRIRARSIERHIGGRAELSDSQVKQIEPYCTSQPIGTISLDVRAYFSTKVGVVEVKQRFERRKV